MLIKGLKDRMRQGSNLIPFLEEANCCWLFAKSSLANCIIVGELYNNIIIIASRYVSSRRAGLHSLSDKTTCSCLFILPSELWKHFSLIQNPCPGILFRIILNLWIHLRFNIFAKCQPFHLGMCCVSPFIQISFISHKDSFLNLHYGKFQTYTRVEMNAYVLIS